MSVQSKIQTNTSGLLLYGITPPKKNNPAEKLQSISQKRLERLAGINADGLVIYDIQDESSRESGERPFPFLDTVDPIEYYIDYMQESGLEPIIYQCAGKYSHTQIKERLERIDANNLKNTVFVGASSSGEQVKTSLSQAYGLYKENEKKPGLGAVVIPERHESKGSEHVKMLRKQEAGVRFFISQFVFNIEKLKNLLSDYYYHCRDNKLPMAYIIITLTPCGSQKTVDLLKWLGVDVPKWIENELVNADDALQQSLDLNKRIAREICEFCMAKGISFGFNIESVSIKKDEVLASFELARDIEKLLQELQLR